MTYLSIMFSQSSSSPLSPNTVAIVVGTVHVRRWLHTKAACRHPVKSKPEPFWPVMSARLAHAVSGPHGALTWRESVCWVCGRSNNCFLLLGDQTDIIIKMSRAATINRSSNKRKLRPAIFKMGYIFGSYFKLIAAS